jgi:hypothetical protein
MVVGTGFHFTVDPYTTLITPPGPHDHPYGGVHKDVPMCRRTVSIHATRHPRRGSVPMYSGRSATRTGQRPFPLQWVCDLRCEGSVAQEGAMLRRINALSPQLIGGERR